VTSLILYSEETLFSESERKKPKRGGIGCYESGIFEKGEI
jgi:hypothetical protein